MRYDIESIPTVYNGVRYRSRLEAKWAAFFTLAEWRFEYEPFDLPGWSPDFLLIGKNKNVLVEVKPITKPCHSLMKRMINSAVTGGLGCDDGDENSYDLLLLGVGPFWLKETECWSGGLIPVLGWINEGVRLVDAGGNFSLALFSKFKSFPKQLDFCHEYLSYEGRITCCHVGNPTDVYWEDVWDDVAGLWGDACHKVQYQPRKRVAGASR